MGEPQSQTHGLDVFGFETPHRLGSVCRLDCHQCPGGTKLFGINGKRLPETPLYIVAEATEDDWRRCVLEKGAIYPYPGSAQYFYFVRTD